MRHFELHEPHSLAEACSALGLPTAPRPIAGGTALLTMIKQGLLAPEALVNLKKVRDGSAISFDEHYGLRIGALATISEIETSPLVRAHYAILAEACHLVANIRIRNMATIGGNLAHGDYQSDPPTALVALDATVELTSPSSTRSLKLGDFQRGSYETALQENELITAIAIPPLPQGFNGVYIKFTTGSAEERPCAGVAALARMGNGVCDELRLAVGAVSPRVIRITIGVAHGQILDSQLIEQIGVEAARAVDPIEDLRGSADYKRHLVAVLVRRALAAVSTTNTETQS